MVDFKTWEDFRESGLLWWVNMILYTFGWAICLEMKSDEIVGVYPARVKFRGFSGELNDDGYRKVSKYLKENSEALYEEYKG